MQVLAVILSASAHVVFVVISVMLIVRDVRDRRLPNRTLAWGTLGVLVLLLSAAWLGDAWPRLATAAATAAVYGGVMLALWIAAPTALGAGDVKLAPLLGLLTGWAGIAAASLWMPIALAVMSGVVGVIQLLRRRKELPFGPVMILACWCAIALQHALPTVGPS